MKTTVMTNCLQIRAVAYRTASLLIGFTLMSCSGVPLKDSKPQPSIEHSDPYPSESMQNSPNSELASVPALEVTESSRNWMDLSWGGSDESSDPRLAGVKGEGSNFLSLPLGSSEPVEGDPEKPENGSVPEDLKIEEKNVQPSNTLKEEENSDQARLYDAIDFCQKSQELWKEGRLEKAKECLDQAYQSILDIKSKADPEIVQQVDDLRFMISKRILEIYASRFNGVTGNHNEIPLVINDHVRSEIKRFQTTERDFFLDSYTRSGRYRPLILEKLEEAGLPLELSWLPLIESGFKVRAFSRSRALGLWQFIPSTGYKFGLKRNQWIDERMDVEKSTDAAIAYLKELHEIFGDWTTVLAAYNCGEGTVLRRIRRQRINYLDDFWDLYERLPRETARYVPRYLAVLHIMKDPHLYGFELNGPDSRLAYEEVRISKRVRLSDVARTMGVSEGLLIELNPELRYKATPDGYDLKVPPGEAEGLLVNLAEIPRYVPPKRQYVYHRVRRGETLSHIAKNYRTSVRAIANANGIAHKDLIRIGQKLKIPAR